MRVRPMSILWEKLPNGTWRMNNGNMTRNRTALRKVTNRFMKRKLWFCGSSIEAY